MSSRDSAAPAQEAPLSTSAVVSAAPRGTLAERLIAVVALAALAVRVSLGPDITPGLVVALLLSPVWMPHLRRFRGARPLIVVALGSVAAGAVVASFATPQHRVLPSAQLTTLVLILTFLGGLGVVLWSRSYLSTPQIGVAFGVGLVGNVLIRGDVGLAAGNPLKFAWALPVAVILLSLAAMFGRRIVELGSLVVLSAGLSFIDARSMFAISLLALFLVGWQFRSVAESRRAVSRTSSWAWTGALLGAVGVAVYQLSTALLVDGVLGGAAQQRSIAQIQTSGSLLLGGRPELGATLSLMGYKPMGFGLGVVADFNEIEIAKKGMASFNYDPNNGYVDHFMFGSKVELHSLFGDLWASFGVAGLVLVALVAFHVVRGLAVQVAERRGSGIVMMLSVLTLWNLAFSPVFASVPALLLALGVLLLPSADPRTRAPNRQPLPT